MSYYSFFPIGHRVKVTFHITKYTVSLLTTHVFVPNFKDTMMWDKENWFLHKEFIVIWTFLGPK